MALLWGTHKPHGAGFGVEEAVIPLYVGDRDSGSLEGGSKLGT